MTEKKHYGAYGPYTISENGLPDFNEVVIDFLALSKLSMEYFGDCYGRAVRGKPYTRVRIFQMIRDKSFPTDPKRRWILAKLLQIPPFLVVGEAPLDSLLQLTEAPKRFQPTVDVKSFDLKESQQELKRYWRLNRLNTAYQHVKEIEVRIERLEKEILYNTAEQKNRIVSLLCGYHMLISNMLCDKEEYGKAVLYLNRAYILAKEYRLYELQATILCRRGWVCKERGEIAASLGNFDIARRDFTFATNDFLLARSLERYLSPGVNGSILISLGQLHAHIATDPQTLHLAVKEIDKTEGFVGKKGDNDSIHYVVLDEERYYLDKAAAYLAAPVKIARYPRDARRELRNALAVQQTPTPKRRLAYNTVLLAKSYAVEGEYEEAMKTLKDALVQVQVVHSNANLGRIAGICEVIKTSEYGKNNIGVVALELEVLKAHQSGLL